MPAIAAIVAGKELAGVRAHVDTAGVLSVGAHGMAQHPQHHTGTCWQALGERFPVLSSVLGAIDSEMLADI
ncbi:MAG: hypothetical protein ACJ788_15360, partial [Ktedonobacteraceae bacterium]